MKVLLGTRKGLLLLARGADDWSLAHVHFDGVTAHVAYSDPRTGHIWVGVHHGHWGPKVHVSKDGGATFEEMPTPKFPEDSGVNLKGIWAITGDREGRLYLGAEPACLFYSDDQGATWDLCPFFMEPPQKESWFGGGADMPCLHSVLIHPDDPNRLVIGISVAGVLRSDDRGATWRFANKGSKAYYLPDPDAEVGQDPHRVVAHPYEPDTLWQQNHCGLFVSRDYAESWEEVSAADGILSSFGWAIAVADDGAVFTVPSKSDECRISVEGALIVQVTRDGGTHWQVLREGLPQHHVWDICYRHALDTREAVVMFGTTNGNLYVSEDRGARWRRLFDGTLPPIYAVHFA